MPTFADKPETLESLIARWRKIAANISEMIPVSVEVQSMGKSCTEHADELAPIAARLRGSHGKLNAFVHWLDLQERAEPNGIYKRIADKLCPIVNELEAILGGKETK